MRRKALKERPEAQGKPAMELLGKRIPWKSNVV
jgi:hypothetical protein